MNRIQPASTIVLLFPAQSFSLVLDRLGVGSGLAPAWICGRRPRPAGHHRTDNLK